MEDDFDLDDFYAFMRAMTGNARYIRGGGPKGNSLDKRKVDSFDNRRIIKPRFSTRFPKTVRGEGGFRKNKIYIYCQNNY